MAKLAYSELLLQTAFCCMASDGDIDQTEVDLIRKLNKDEGLFDVDNFEDELNKLVIEINEKGMSYLREYLEYLSEASLSTDEEINIVKVAVKTIKADGEEQYSEIKFFKIIRSKLRVSNAELIGSLPEFDNLEDDYLTQDIISRKYLERLDRDYFNNESLPTFSSIKTDKKQWPQQN